MKILKLMLLLWLISVIVLLGRDYPPDKKQSPQYQSLQVEANNLKCMLGSTGEIMEMSFPAGGSNYVLFSLGIGVSAFINDSLRVSVMFPSDRDVDFQTGMVGMDPDDPTAIIYTVNYADGPGSENYVNWSTAVSMGAHYVDVNSDGFYDPIIDEPEIMGSKTYWTVYNDVTDRLPDDTLTTAPLYVEVRQTLWFYEYADGYENTVFIRYEITNKNEVPLTDTYLSVLSDPDIGDYGDDLVGCDTLFQVGYAYGNRPDMEFGENPPALGVVNLMGPLIDDPDSSAILYRGLNAGTITIEGKRNLKMSSFTPYKRHFLPLEAPDTAWERRWLMEGGLDTDGTPINPETLSLGIGGTAADNPKFIFSGDPVTNQGWIDTFFTDWRFQLNTGPINLEPNDTNEWTVAIVVGQGTDALSGVTALRQNIAGIRDFYQQNWQLLSVGKDGKTTLEKSFELGQNFPNPFNPSTTIPFTLYHNRPVSLNIYNSLGQLVKTVFSGELVSGYHTLIWDGKDNYGNQAPSGVYYYQMISGSYRMTGKMLKVE